MITLNIQYIDSVDIESTDIDIILANTISKSQHRYDDEFFNQDFNSIFN